MTDLICAEHFVDVGDGVTLHVVERRLREDRGPARAILMIPPTLATSALYDVRIEGDASTSALDRAARAGFVAFAVSY